MTEGNDEVMKIETLLKLTDWTMTEPVDGSTFHLIIAVVGILFAIIAAVAFAGKQRLAAFFCLARFTSSFFVILLWTADIIV